MYFYGRHRKNYFLGAPILEIIPTVHMLYIHTCKVHSTYIHTSIQWLYMYVCTNERRTFSLAYLSSGNMLYHKTSGNVSKCLLNKLEGYAILQKKDEDRKG